MENDQNLCVPVYTHYAAYSIIAHCLTVAQVEKNDEKALK